MPTRNSPQDLAARVESICPTRIPQDLATRETLVSGSVLPASSSLPLSRLTSSLIQIGIGLSRVGQFLSDVVKGGWFCGKLLIGSSARILHSYSLLRVGHINLRLSYLIMAALLVHLDHVAYMLLPSTRRPANAGTEVRCPNGYAYRIPEDGPHLGRYVSCENFDAYYAHIYENQQDLAAQYLIGGSK